MASFFKYCRRFVWDSLDIQKILLRFFLVPFFFKSPPQIINIFTIFFSLFLLFDESQMTR